MLRTPTGKDRHSISLFLILLTGLSLLYGCYSGTIYSHYEPVPLDGWWNTDTIRFELGPVMDGGTFHDEVTLRTTTAYPYTQLAVVVRQQVIPNGEARTDSITLLLTDNQGNPSGVGTIHRHHSLELRPLHIEKDQQLAVSIYHNMKKECLSGITDIGITITKK